MKTFVNTFYTAMASFGAIGVLMFFILVIGVILAGILFSITGIIVTFSTSVVLGLVFIFLPAPMFTITGLLWYFNVNIPEIIKTSLNLPF